MGVTPIKKSAKSNKTLLFVYGFDFVSDNIEWHLNKKKGISNIKTKWYVNKEFKHIYQKDWINGNGDNEK